MSPIEEPLDIAVIGAGLAGLTAARRLAAAGHSVTVFEKSRGRGGRLSTRRQDGWTFDHGAQYFTARGAGFRTEVEGWLADGVAAPWTGRVVDLPSGAERDGDRFVGVPGMSGIGRHLARDLTLKLRSRVESVDALPEGGWSLYFDGDRERMSFDAVLVATPAEQAVPLLSAAPELASRVSGVETDPCWAVMLGLAVAIDADFDGAKCADGPLAWVARDASKPERGRARAGESWVLHATPEWSAEHLAEEPNDVAWELIRAFRDVVGRRVPPVIFADAHRWRYARTATPLGEAALWDPARRIGACGDWCLGARVESAWESGAALAEQVLRDSASPAPPAVTV